MTDPIAYVAESSVTCPSCDQVTTELMPADACIFAYICPVCGTEIRATAGRCVYCAHGSVPCPPVQIAEAKGEQAHCCRRPSHGQEANG